MRPRAVTRFPVLRTRRTPRFLLVLLALALPGGCGGDSAAPTATTPAAAPPPPAPAPVPEPTCEVGMVLRPGTSCPYPGTSNTLTIKPDGTASFLFVTSGSAIDVTSGNISLQATRQSDGSWRIERVGASSSAEGTTFREWGDGISIASGGRILVELQPEDTGPANRFDLNGKTVVFTPDGSGGYSRSVRPVAWEEDLGETVRDGAEIALGFRFRFGGQTWSSFRVSEYGAVTFGELTERSFDQDSVSRFDTMQDIANAVLPMPSVSPLFKPWLDRQSDLVRLYVRKWPDRVVVTWFSYEPAFWVHGLRPESPARFQAVLGTDGSIRFHYADVPFGDGVVGLFSNEQIKKGALIATIPDATNRDLPAHLDLLEVAIYESDTDAVIIEFTTRGPIVEPPPGVLYSYRLYLDTDKPYWSRTDHEDEDLAWIVDLEADGNHRTRGGTRLPESAPNRIALLADITNLFGTTASVIPDAAQFDIGGFVQGNWGVPPTLVKFPDAKPKPDLSLPDRGSFSRHSEVFHYRGVPDTGDIACRVVEALGDEFDALVWHSEFRMDIQDTASAWHQLPTDTKGTGRATGGVAPCGNERLKGYWTRPIWIRSFDVFEAPSERRYPENDGFDRGLFVFAHEFAHVWTVFASYLRNGERERLAGRDCGCHWRTDLLHQTPPFPWHPEVTGARSVMADSSWREGRDGTFTRLEGWRFALAGGFSWLDLYMMGLADTEEVPPLVILRNLKPVRAGDPQGLHTAEKEIVTIKQVIAAEGPRNPPAARSQKVFNVGFVYLLEPGQTPDPDMLRLHRDYRDKVIEHWSHITGGRSEITTVVLGGASTGLRQ